MSNKMIGREAIKLMKGIFNIKQDRINEMTIHPPANDVATIDIKTYLTVNESTEVTSEEVGRESKYEVTVIKVSK